MVEDLNDMDGLLRMKRAGREPGNVDPTLMQAKDTLMWNPLHFAVFQGHFDVIKYLENEIKIDIGLAGPKNLAINEGEQVNNQEAFIEDTVFIL